MLGWHLRAAIASSAVVTALVAPAAHGDIFAVTDKSNPVPASNDDVVMVDTAGLAASLPAGVNTAAEEIHPSVSADGKRLVFERQPDSSTTRIIVVDLDSGQQSDVINGFDAASIGPTTPSITPDGNSVLVGTSNVPGPVVIDVSAFPSGPYPHSAISGADHPFDPVATGSARGSEFAFAASGLSAIEYGRIGGSALRQVPPGETTNLTPALGSPAGTPTVIFVAGNPFGNADIHFCAPLSPTRACQLASLPATVNTSADETRAAFTPDGRYVGFVRNGRVFVWDSDTQTLLNDSGTVIGTPGSNLTGNLSLFERPVFHFATVSKLGQVNFSLASAALVGIIVQRIEGHRKLFGRTVPKLGPARRVPLGSFKRGRGKAHWNLRLGGKALKPGKYQVTPRALTRKGKVRDLGKPRLLRIH